MEERGSDFGTWVGGFILGMVTGAAIALLMAPQSGEETRGLIQEKSIHLRERAADTAETARQQAKTVAEQARGRISTIQEQGKSLLREGRQSLRQAGEDISDIAESGGGI
ncbi:MAG TPA: YtxH domain-containing protein [Chloroflexi bacterium]|jgi:gas vesicle protein|nr:YtxH domain-containing protein [Chloroflexota bacterium]HPO59117.1 YtxH domain-containing protein [Anaerolineaceae bacterium]